MKNNNNNKKNVKKEKKEKHTHDSNTLLGVLILLMCN